MTETDRNIYVALRLRRVAHTYRKTNNALFKEYMREAINAIDGGKKEARAIASEVLS